MTHEQRRETRIIRCPACKRYYRIPAGPPVPGARLRCSKCGEVFSPRPAAESTAGASAAPPSAAIPARGRVLVSTDGEDFQALIGEVLTAAGYTLRPARSGEEAWDELGGWRPHVALLDVALPGVPAFELCDRVRADKALAGTGLILIASVFQQTRYKRAPTSLYGADDYIEKHHIRDRLPEKVARLCRAGATKAGPASPPAAARQAGEKREQESLIHEELYGPQAGQPRQGLHRLQERLRRYARIIISDIALYNQELVERGIREGTFSEVLKKEIEEGFRLYQLRVPSSSGAEEYYHEAVRDFIARRSGSSRPPGKR